MRIARMLWRSVSAVAGRGCRGDTITARFSPRWRAIRGNALHSIHGGSGPSPSRIQACVTSAARRAGFRSASRTWSTSSSAPISASARSTGVSAPWGDVMSVVRTFETSVSNRSCSASAAWAPRRWARLASRPTMSQLCSASRIAAPTMKTRYCCHTDGSSKRRTLPCGSRRGSRLKRRRWRASKR